MDHNAASLIGEESVEQRMQLRQIARLDDWYRFEPGTLFITGLQALVRLLPNIMRTESRAFVEMLKALKQKKSL